MLFSFLTGCILVFSTLGAEKDDGAAGHVSTTSLVSTVSLLFYQHFTNKMYIFLLIFVASVGNIKRDLTFHTIIIHPTEIIWKDRNVSLLIKLCISFEVFLMPRKVFVVFNNKIINNFRCILEFQQLVQIIEIVMLTNENV